MHPVSRSFENSHPSQPLLLQMGTKYSRFAQNPPPDFFSFLPWLIPLVIEGSIWRCSPGLPPGTSAWSVKGSKQAEKDWSEVTALSPQIKGPGSILQTLHSALSSIIKDLIYLTLLIIHSIYHSPILNKYGRDLLRQAPLWHKGSSFK